MKPIAGIRQHIHGPVCTATLTAFLIMACGGLALAGEVACAQHNLSGPAMIERVHFGSGQGEGYRMVYCIDVPLAVYWQFKTDFQNDFLTDNPHIDTHHFIDQQDNVVLTENRYAHDRKRLFRWQTTIHARDHRLEFKLVNADEAGQKFHFGTIRLESRGNHTIVYQFARFRFSGAAVWAWYPWRGGMRSFLSDFVRWEQQTAVDWQSVYEAQLQRRELHNKRMRQIFSTNSRHPVK